MKQRRPSEIVVKMRATAKSGRLALEACGLFVLMAAGAAQATTLVQEGFSYPPAAPVNGTQTGGVGFAASSS